MVETTANEILDGAKNPVDIETPTENLTEPSQLTEPAQLENPDVSGDGATTEQPEQAESETTQAEQPKQTSNDTIIDYIGKPDTPIETPTPDTADTPVIPDTLTPEVADTPVIPDAPDKSDGDGDMPVPSNVIDGHFGDKQAANEVDKQDAEQNNPEKDAPADEQTQDKQATRRGRPPKAEKPDKEPQAEKSDSDKTEKPKRGGRPPKAAKEDGKAVSTGGGGIGGASSQTADKEEAPQSATVPENVTPAPEPPRDATRPGEKETIIYIDHSELHPFKNHPFQVRDDEAMKTLVASVKERGVDQPAIVRPRESDGYEIIAGHRRQVASEQAGLKNIPCVVRNMTDDEAILAMTESNFNQRSEILPSERAQALKMQLDAIKRQGARFNGIASGDIGKRSNEIVADRNQMAVKQVQRYIALNNLTPDLMKFVDDKKVPFTAAVEMSYIRPKNQNYIAVAIDSQQSSPSLAQAQRMRELDQKNVLNGDVIDGIMLEEKKEETRVILNSQELGKYFGPDKTPREMKDTILKLLDEYKEKQPFELGKPERKAEMEK